MPLTLSESQVLTRTPKQGGREGQRYIDFLLLALSPELIRQSLSQATEVSIPKPCAFFHFFFRLAELMPILPAGWIIANSTGWLNLCQFYRLGFFWPPFRIREKVVEISRAAQLVVRLISTTFSGLQHHRTIHFRSAPGNRNEFIWSQAAVSTLLSIHIFRKH